MEIITHDNIVTYMDTALLDNWQLNTLRQRYTLATVDQRGYATRF
jgi:hypothetical protein